MMSGRGQGGTTTPKNARILDEEQTESFPKGKRKKKWTGWKPKTDERKIGFRKKVMENGDDNMCKYSQLHMSVERERKDHATSRLQ